MQKGILIDANGTITYINNIKIMLKIEILSRKQAVNIIYIRKMLRERPTCLLSSFNPSTCESASTTASNAINPWPS